VLEHIGVYWSVLEHIEDTGEEGRVKERVGIEKMK
jgi:hypothetical protein